MKKACLFFLFLSFFCFGFDHTDTTVKADSATYDGARILLKGNVDISNKSYEIQSQTAILTRDLEKKTRFEFPWIELDEKIHAHFLSQYFLECDKVLFDYVAQHLLFTSENRIYFYENQRKVYAEKADVEYFENEKGVQISKITLTGNVEMHHVCEEAGEKKEQYALADRVEYYPEKELIFLKADPEKRVLFFDKIHEITISSQTVKAQKKEGKESIEGIGDVRLVFKEDELEKLKKRFKFNQL